MAAVREHLEQVELARELGFSSVWTSQHFLSHPFLYFQSVPLLARVAAAAEGMTVGTAILLLTLLNPVEVAENAATLDAIAGGRFVLGVGIGYRAVENAAFGVAQRRADLFERKLDILRRLQKTSLPPFESRLLTSPLYRPEAERATFTTPRDGRRPGAAAPGKAAALVSPPVRPVLLRGGIDLVASVFGR